MARPWKRRAPKPEPIKLSALKDDMGELVERYRSTLMEAALSVWYVEHTLEPALDEAVAALAFIARLETQPAAAEVARRSLARVHHLLD